MEVDSEIARVQSQIDKVEKDIELVESECRTALTSEDKQYLREKEKALRAEKNALREKENRLLEKENKLLDLQLKNGKMVGQTSREFALGNVPFMEKRQRKFCSVTKPTAPRTFTELEEWSDFMQSSDALVQRLDDSQASHDPSTNYFLGRNLLAPADEAEVRGYIGTVFYFGANKLATELGIPFQYKGGGHGRGLSFTDCVIIDTTQGSPSPADSPSARVFGAGEIKGPWQFELDHGGQSYIDAVRAGNEHAIQVLQQLYGDLVMEEAYAGFVSNYNQTVFFKRSDNVKCKKLLVSPVINYNESPLKAFLYLLHLVYENRGKKDRLPRNKVEVTPAAGYMLKLPPLQCFMGRSQRLSSIPNPRIQVKAKRSKRRQRDEEGIILVDTSKLEVDATTRIEDLPSFTFEALGMTSACLAEGWHGKVLEGFLETIPLAIKAFDPAKLFALEAFDRERKAYRQLQMEQGISIPILFFVGRLAHTSWPFLAMSREGVSLDNIKREDMNSSRIRSFKKKVKKNLARVHELGVLHNDVRASNILISSEDVKIIDFGSSEACDRKSDLKFEISEVDAVFDMVFGVL